MKCPIHGIEKVLKIVDDEGIKESYPVHTCFLCAKEILEEIRSFQGAVPAKYDPQEIEMRRAS